jgi:hypothetical protein
MNKSTNRYEINAALLSYHQDGLLDLCMGFSLLTFGFAILTGNTWLGAILPAALIPTWLPIRNSFLHSRVGVEDLRSAGEGWRLMAMMGFFMLTMLGGVAAFAAIVLFSGWMRTWVSEYLMLLLGLGGAGMLVAIGFIMGAKRLYAYAALTMIIFAASYLLAAPLWLSLVALAVSMILIGSVVLVRFLSEHPRIS